MNKKLLRRRWVQLSLVLMVAVLIQGIYSSIQASRSGKEKPTPFASTSIDGKPEILKPIREFAGKPSSENPGGNPNGIPDEDLSEEAVPPGMEQLKEELENGPPAKGPSIVRYAEKLTDKMGDAEENPAKVPEVFKELERCMRGEAQDDVESAMQLPAVKAMCLFNAGELAQQYPEYKERHRRMSESASQQVRDILKYTEGE